MSDSIRVLIVDDSAVVRLALTEILSADPAIEVMATAADPLIAASKIDNERPDVITLDVEMPRMDGYELARHMRSTPELSDIPIIMITSRSGDKHRNRALELGVKRYLGKPYQDAQLLEAIRRQLEEKGIELP